MLGKAIPVWLWAVGAALLLTAVGWSLSRPKNYDECMLSEMRGQPQSMQLTVDKVCARRFRREVLIFEKIDFDWTADGNVVSVKFKSENTDYIVTRAGFRVSDKPCKDISNKDFSKEVVEASDGDAFTFLASANIHPICMNARAIKGRYR